MGWLPDLPDSRDSTLDIQCPKFRSLDDGQRAVEDPTKQTDEQKLYAQNKERIKKMVISASARLPSVDHRKFCSPIEDQESLGSCTAQACVGMVEYMERRTRGRHIDASKLFLYKVTRKLLGLVGDTGAYPRTTMKALALFGVPPEKWWSYDISTFEAEPDAFLYAHASNYQALQYLRLDPADADGQQVLDNVRGALAANYTVMFGFTVFSSLGSDPDIPYPTEEDSVSGGHAVLAVGYKDDHENVDGKKGALLIRNSWGTDWGEEGYGWLPYDYVRRGLARDFWTCFKMEWVALDGSK